MPHKQLQQFTASLVSINAVRRQAVVNGAAAHSFSVRLKACRTINSPSLKPMFHKLTITLNE